MTQTPEERLERIERLLNKQIADQAKFNLMLETYQKHQTELPISLYGSYGICRCGSACFCRESIG